GKMKRFLIVVLSVMALCAAQTGLLAQATPGAAGTAGAKAQKTKTMSANGTVKSVSGDSLVVTANGKDLTFAIDGSTKFVGKGLGTKAAGGKLTATDAV